MIEWKSTKDAVFVDMVPYYREDFFGKSDID